MIATTKAQQLAMVVITEDLPHYGVKKGERGTVLEIFDTPEEAYMIEFDEDSDIDLRIADWVYPHQFEVEQSAADLSQQSFREILAPMRAAFEASGMTLDELDALVKEEREAMWREKQNGSHSQP